jgi:hypothetical protein
MDEIVLRTDVTLRCPREGCSTRIGLTREGADMAMAQAMKCREHNEPLEAA